MAKHHTQSRAIVRARPIMFKAPRPIVLRAKTRVVHVKAKKHHHKKHHKSMLGGFLTQKQINAALGAAALGFIEKTFTTLPAVPVIGKNGTIALGAYLLRGKFPLADDICTAAIVISAYELANTGKITGGEVEGGYVAGGF
jgi:hypothetical protein